MLRLTGTLHEYLCTFITIYHLILLRIRNVSDKSFSRETKHFMFNNYFPKLVPFMTLCEKNLAEQIWCDWTESHLITN
jgi:hypothetical protein